MKWKGNVSLLHPLFYGATLKRLIHKAFNILEFRDQNIFLKKFTAITSASVYQSTVLISSWKKENILLLKLNISLALGTSRV